MGVKRICFVCLGNICRSPTAEAVMRQLVKKAGLAGEIAIESAGTAGYHQGDSADHRSVAAAERRGVPIRGRARQFVVADFERLDVVLGVDQSTCDKLRRLAKDEQQRSKVRLLRSFDPTASAGAEVPDPYYGGEQGFEDVLDMCERACQGLLMDLSPKR